MKTAFPNPRTGRSGSALLMTMVMVGIALLTVAAALAYCATNARLNYRSNQYHSAVAAAEGATEKVVTMLSRDYLSGGEVQVTANLDTYRHTTPNSADSSFWADWQFNDASGNSGQTYVLPGTTSNYIVLDSTYAGLRGYASTYTVVSNARETPAPQDVVAGVMQQLELARIPIFQFAMYSSGEMEVSCGQPFTITGPVHANGQLYVEPSSVLTFQSDVTAVGDILFQRDPLDTRSPPLGTAIYQGRKDSHVAAMTLPIGTNNSPSAIREIIEPPPPLESPTSAMGRLRYYNLADMVMVVTNSGTNTGVAVTSGSFNGFSTPVPTNEVNLFASTLNSFWDAREGKTVLPLDINVAALAAWSTTNSNVRVALGSNAVASIYVWDRRTLPGTSLGAVRVSQGTQLPPRGLTVASGSPIYVWGHYNQYSSTNLGTANTTTTLPASLVGDALTVLSPNWTDANSTAAVGSRNATPTTVNAAILAGAVDTTLGFYSGGMENFPRFLETWGLANPLTYNGSMVKMFPSLYATNVWGKANVYAPPKRDWAYDTNFNDPSKLPPLTPSVLKVIRGLWATVGPNQTTPPAN
ncbi:MAG TPA: hypothetical protein VN578_25675 [Candidatus Binatia bacterium]|jgi:hypothetical protein|nr:hypothetical protein [Candidatus Binatia bacterium]